MHLDREQQNVRDRIRGLLVCRSVEQIACHGLFGRTHERILAELYTAQRYSDPARIH
jgi:hypothetical protein